MAAKQKNKKTSSRDWGEDELYGICVARIETRRRLMLADDTWGDNISLLSREMKIPNPLNATAEAILGRLRTYIAEHPVKGYTMGAELEKQGQRSAIRFWWSKNM